LFKRAAAALPARLNNSSARALMQKKLAVARTAEVLATTRAMRFGIKL